MKNTERSQSLVVLLLVGAAIVVAVNAWLAFRAEETFSESERWVSHTWQVINGVEVLVGSMKDAETGARGYVLAGDASFLNPYTSALTQFLPSYLTWCS